MKLKLLFITLFSFTISFGQNNQEFFNKTDVFLKMYTKDGSVNYNALRTNSAPLDWLVDYLATEDIDNRTRKAYLINAYNVLVINKLVKHNKLVSKPTSISGFFENKDAMLEGAKVSLNQIENEFIRPVYNDNRVHFVLVCGGLGCPPIASFAYRPEMLNAQLESQTKLAMNRNSFVYANADKKTVYLSQIFEWYTSDFGNSIDDVVTYINKYRDTPFNTNHKTNFYPYDWTTNNATFDIIEVSTEQKKMMMKPAIEIPASELVLVETPKTVANGVAGNPIKNDNEEINLQTFTAGSLLAKNKFDFTMFNTLYTENFSNWQGSNFTGFRNTFVTHLFQMTYGITKSKRINVGFDINFKNSGTSPDSTYGGIGEAFTYKNGPTSRVGVTSVGARIKVQPFKDVNNFSIQSTVLLPTVKFAEGRFVANNSPDNLYWAEWDRITWWNQLFIDKSFGDFQIFAELDFLFRFKRNPSQIGMLDLPASVFISYFPSSKITLYAMTQHVARFTNNINGHDPIVTDFVIPMNYTASGVGFKYQIASNFNIEALYTNFWRGKNTGLGETFNIGVKFLTR